METDINVHVTAEDNTANCLKKVITTIHRILVVSVLKTTTYHHNKWLGPKSSSLWSPAVQHISHQPGWLASYNTWLKVISAHRSSLANRAGPAHVIRLELSVQKELHSAQTAVFVQNKHSWLSDSNDHVCP